MPNEDSNADSRRLTVAMELLRRQIRDSVIYSMANKERVGEVSGWANLGAMALANPNKGQVAPPQEPGRGPPMEVTIVGQKPILAVHDVGAGRFGAQEREKQDIQFRQALFGSSQKVPNAEQGPNERQARGQSATAAGSAVTLALVGKFAALFAPLVTLHTILSQTGSGFAVFQKTLSVFAATLAPILLPVFALLAAAVLTLSDEIWNRLLPRLGDWYKLVLDKGIPTMESFIKSVTESADALTYFIDRIRNPEKFVKDFVSSGKEGERARGTVERITDPFGINKSIADAAKQIPGARTVFPWLNFMGSKTVQTAKEMTADNMSAAQQGKLSGLPKYSDRMKQAGIGLAGMASNISGASQQSGGAMSGLRGNLQLVIKSLQQSIVPRPAYQSLTEVGRAANLAAVGRDPIDMKALQRTIQSLEILLEQIAKNTERQQDPTFKGGR